MTCKVDRFAGLIKERIEMDSAVTSLESLTLEIEQDQHRIYNQHDALVSLESLLDNAEGELGVTEYLCLKLNMETLGIATEAISVEGLREQVKILWRGLIQQIVDGIKKIKAWASKMAAALPRLRKYVEEVLNAKSTTYYDTTISLRTEMSSLAGDKLTKENILNGMKVLEDITTDCFRVDFPETLASVDRVLALFKEVPKTFAIDRSLSSYDSRDEREARELTVNLIINSRVQLDVGERNPPAGIWSESLKLRGITTDRYLTFSPRKDPFVGDRFALYRYPRFKDENYSGLVKQSPTITNYAAAGINYLNAIRVDLYSRTNNTGVDEVKLEQLSYDEVQKVCQRCLNILDSFDYYYSYFDEIQEYKEDLIKEGNSAAGIITDDGETNRRLVSELIRGIVRFQTTRLDKPFVSIIGHGVKSIYALMSYAQKSLA